MSTWCYCRSCGRNLELNKQHNFTSTHQGKLQALLEKELNRVRNVKYFLNEITQCTSRDRDFWCFCCEQEIDSSSDKFIGFSALKHLAKTEHKKQLEKFWVDVGVHHLTKPKKLSKFCVSTTDFKEFIKRIKSIDSSSPSVIEPPPPIDEQSMQKMVMQRLLSLENSNVGEKSFSSFPSCAVTDTTRRGEQLDRNRSECGHTDSLSSSNLAVSLYKTVRNSFGVLQNPTGFHNGERVWGGGIVKYKHPSQWLPWPLDEELGSSIGSSLASQEVSTNVRTTFAIGENLTSLAPATLLPGEGNIYSGAPPPWSSAGSIPSPKPTLLSAHFGTPISGPRHRRSTERLGSEFSRQRRLAAAKAGIRLGTDVKLQGGREFLPNFGGVWHDGTRGAFAVIEREKTREKQQEELMIEQEATVSGPMKTSSSDVWEGLEHKLWSLNSSVSKDHTDDPEHRF